MELLSQSPSKKSLDSQLAGAQSNGSADSVWDRERQVLAGGFVEGLGKAAQTTWSDLKEGAAKLADHPVETTGHYLKEHWSEAAVGALITFINPRGAANLALLAYSLRGLGVSTFEAARMAADKDVDLRDARNYYSSAISHEGSAFLASLPMTMAGGMAGRIGGNAIFGKNMGASDLLSGKVSLSDVKENLWNIHDAVRPPSVKLLVTDMDDTLLSTEKHNALGIKRGISELSASTGLSEDVLYKTIGVEMEKFHSRSYPWTMELALAEKLKVGQPGGMSYEQFRTGISDPFWKTMDRTLAEHLTLFDGVRPSLEQLKARGIPVVILSDASASAGLRRATHLGLDKGLVERLYVLRNPEEPTGLPLELLQHGRDRLSSALSARNEFKEFGILPREWEKPRTGGLDSLMRQYRLRPSEVLMVGDNLRRDMGVAADAGTRGLWYAGSKTKTPEFQAIFDRLKPDDAAWTAKAPKTAESQLSGKFPAITNYRQVLDYLNPKADYQAVAAGIARALLVRPPLQAAVLGFGFERH